MKLQHILYFLSLMVFVLACTQQASFRGASGAISASGTESLTTSKLVLNPEKGLSVIEARTRVQESWFDANGVALRTLLEIAPSHDSSGSYTFASSYISLAALIAELNGQSTAYKWTSTTINGELILVIKPTSNSFLDRKVPSFEVNDQTVCEVLKYTTSKVTASSRASGCILRSRPRFISGAGAFSLKDEKLSLAFTASTDVEAVAIAILGSLPLPMSLGVFRPGLNMPYVWEPTW